MDEESNVKVCLNDDTPATFVMAPWCVVDYTGGKVETEWFISYEDALKCAERIAQQKSSSMDVYVLYQVATVAKKPHPTVDITP